jgi:hypothetical protein
MNAPGIPIGSGAGLPANTSEILGTMTVADAALPAPVGAEDATAPVDGQDVRMIAGPWRTRPLRSRSQ